MVDSLRVLTKVDELDKYLAELRSNFPKDARGYQDQHLKRAAERELQLCIETMIDICKKLVIGLRLGIPQEEEDVFLKLEKANVLSPQTTMILRKMRKMRNVLVHEYAQIDDQKVLEVVLHHLGDFETFKAEVLAHLKK